MFLNTSGSEADADIRNATVKVCFFGKLADLFGRTHEIVIPPAGCPLSEVRAAIVESVEGGLDWLSAPGVRAAVGRELVLNDSAWVRPGEEVAFLPAFSGG